MNIQRTRDASKAPTTALPMPIPAASPEDIVFVLFAGGAVDNAVPGGEVVGLGVADVLALDVEEIDEEAANRSASTWSIFVLLTGRRIRRLQQRWEGQESVKYKSDQTGGKKLRAQRTKWI
jgi:hypothetical protein